MACLLGLEGSRGLRRGLSVSLAALALSVIGSVFVAQEAIAAHLPYGPYTCQQGFVWRETVPGDRVCVTPQTRDQVRAENALAASRQSPNGGPYGPKTCMQGFVWRETRPSDRVCVPTASRDQAQRDNAQAPSRLAAPGQTPRGGVTVTTQYNQIGGRLLANGRGLSPNGAVEFYAAGVNTIGLRALSNLEADATGTLRRDAYVADVRCELPRNRPATIVVLDRRSGVVTMAGNTYAFSC